MWSGRPSKEAPKTAGLHAPRAKQAAVAEAPAEALLQAEPDFDRLRQDAAAAMELASDAPGPQLAELSGLDRAELDGGQGQGEADAEDDPWQIPASHEVLLQGMLRSWPSGKQVLSQMLWCLLQLKRQPV